MRVRVRRFGHVLSTVWRRQQAARYVRVSAAVLMFVATAASALAQSPFSGAPSVIPGGIQAEDFDRGGEGVAYHDNSSGNNGGMYRATDVDIESTPTGGYAVAWTGAGEWLRYTVNVTATGNYTIVTRVASAGSGGSFHIEFNGGNRTGSMWIPNTGGWGSYQDLAATAWLDAGVQSMQIVFDSNGSTGAVGNISFLRFDWGGGGSTPTTSVGSSVSCSGNPPGDGWVCINGGWVPPDHPLATGSSGGSTSSGSTSSGSTGGSSGGSSFSGSAWPIPGGIQAEDFDNGGEGVAYHDNSPGNNGGVYRSTDVDIERTPTGGYAVAWTGAGEWLRYTVNVTAAGSYTIVARVASAGGGGTFHIEFNGQDRTGSVRIPNTGGWSSYQDLPFTARLDAGVQAMHIVFESNGSTGAVGNISFLSFELGGSAPAATAPPPSTSGGGGGGGGRLRVMTWNINFGHGDPWGQAQEIANSGADVALLQEASTFDEDMPSTYPTRLRQMTGQTWYSVWSGGSCACQGTLILSRFPIVDSGVAWLDGTASTRVLVDVGGVRVNLFNIHLEYYDTGKRSSQLLQFMDWTRQFGGPRIAGGDFNSWWDEWWIRQMKTEYSDTWQDVTGGVGDGYTLNGSVRFDYLFRAFDANWRLTPTACWVSWTSKSDHYPVVADYNVQ